MSPMADLFIFAGEASADLLGAELLKALRDSGASLNITGVGGPKMRSEGFSCVAKMEDFRVMGFVDVFLALPKLIKQFFTIRATILKMNPKIVLFIDYPGFNLRMARSLRKKGFKGKLCHFVCPSVWAWGKGRIPIMAKNLDLLLATLPFEARYFTHTPLQVKYVGHPLAERIKNHLPRKELIFDGRRLISIFPGSRRKEIERNFPIYLRVVKKLIAEDPTLFFGISISHATFTPLLKEIIEKEGLSLEKEVALIEPEDTYALMRASELAIAKSGTVTLELALHGVPTVVTYAISPLDLIIVRWILRIRLPFYCLVNIIKEEAVFPELFGPNFTEESLYSHVSIFLKDSKIRDACKQKCQTIATSLGEKESLKEAANLLRSTL